MVALVVLRGSLFLPLSFHNNHPRLTVRIIASSSSSRWDAANRESSRKVKFRSDQKQVIIKTRPFVNCRRTLWWLPRLIPSLLPYDEHDKRRLISRV